MNSKYDFMTLHEGFLKDIFDIVVDMKNNDGFDIVEKLKKLGINYLINVGPDYLGRIPLKAQEILKKVAELEQKKS